MASSAQFVRFVEDLFHGVPEVKIRRMFGGVGVFRNGLMFALGTSEGRVALKADEGNVEQMRALGAEEWIYENRSGQRKRMGYWYIPESVIEDSACLTRWAEDAFAAARRLDEAKPPGQRKFTG